MAILRKICVRTAHALKIEQKGQRACFTDGPAEFDSRYARGVMTLHRLNSADVK